MTKSRNTSLSSVASGDNAEFKNLQPETDNLNNEARFFLKTAPLSLQNGLILSHISIDSMCYLLLNQ